MTDSESIARRLQGFPSAPLLAGATPISEMTRLRAALGGGPRLLVKRDDAIPFGFGGNKVRKLEFTAAAARAEGADTLVTVGGVQSNHARATAAVAAKLGMRCLLIINGAPPERPTANARLDQLLGADIHYIPSRAERADAARDALASLERAGRRPFWIPLGASTPLGALGFVRAVDELLEQGPPPDVIVSACSSGGTAAGLAAGIALNELSTRLIGISADDPAKDIEATVRGLVEGIGPIIGVDGPALAARCKFTVDDTRVGDGYGVPTDASREAQELAARCEALFVDHTYTAKALGGLIARVRDGEFRADQTVLFWHTGGQVGLFA
jgi:1-aminocyclopropane-1-carboxylate deaminase/D-cysteine desulfhydrase-like pyridoxal-dependent ACC family enzyme